MIHSGIYYRPGSLKGEFCVRGRDALVRFCEEHEIPYELCGKLIVATREEELPRLDALAERATANGVQGHELVGPERVREIEPHVSALRALRVPSTGIVDFTRLAEAYAGIVREAGGEVLLNAPVRSSTLAGGVRHLRAGDEERSARLLVNCAGLHADRVARQLGASTPVADRALPGRVLHAATGAHGARARADLPGPGPGAALPRRALHAQTSAATSRPVPTPCWPVRARATASAT